MNRRPVKKHPEQGSYKSSNSPNNGADCVVVEALSHLPDVGVDVFIWRHDSDRPEYAVLDRYSGPPRFIKPSFALSHVSLKHNYVDASCVARWDYAVPAGDLLC